MRNEGERPRISVEVTVQGRHLLFCKVLELIIALCYHLIKLLWKTAELHLKYPIQDQISSLLSHVG